MEELAISVAAKVMQVYAHLAPRVHAAWTSFWYPGIEVIPGTSVGCVRVSERGRVYGIYVPLDVPAWDSGSGAEVLLTRSDGSVAWLDPAPVPGLRLRLTPAALGGVRATRTDPLDDAAEEFDPDTLLP